ncbi:MAG: hypothetical protein AW10_00092 [Candidatus Accumulibacter appositus]|uniref:Uncharacterized protein n=1 Tax=Candidatus Accumulibacter appositus TaxID=1454003 RepID=A0A011P6Q9_9PROT|nr:MAG: hypothetical protein AW10_00092 [Candidatus Accumulibacter appositus]
MLASAQIASTSSAPRTASPGSSRTYLGKIGAHSVVAVLPTMKPIAPRPSACCRIIAEMVRLRAPISLSTAISRTLFRVMV